jgi:cation diffusion facilitator family transporter
MTKERFIQAETAAWVGIIGNIALAAIKGIAGYLAGSKALIADAAHSASDAAGSIAVLIGLRAAKLPPDVDHPYEHGKAESIAAIIVSVLLLVVGIEIGISSVKAFVNGVEKAPEWFAILAIAVSLIAKEAMFRYKYSLGMKLASQALIANAREHRSDVYSSLAALAGVGGALLGGYLNMPLLFLLDPLAGVLVSILVLKMGCSLVREAIHNTMEHVMHKEDTRELLRTVQSVKGVITVDGMRAREHGHYVIVDVKISVNPRIAVIEGHDIAKQVKYLLMKRFIHVSDVFVHVNPYDPGYPYRTTGEPNQEDYPAVLH